MSKSGLSNFCALVMIPRVLKYGTVLLDLFKTFQSISWLLNDPVILKSSARLGQCALWDCFGNAIASFIGYYYEVALETEVRRGDLHDDVL